MVVIGRVLALALLLLAGNAFAGWRMSFSGNTVYGTEAAGCAAFLADDYAKNPSHNPSWTVQKVGTSPNSVCYLFAGGNAQNGDQLVYTTDPVTPADPNAACTPKAGTSAILNWTAGWQRTPSIGDSAPMVAPNPLGAYGSVCTGGCEQSFETAAPCPTCGAFVSQQPNAQGLYRVTIQFSGKFSGTACTASAADNPATPDNSKDPACPGYVGEMNGVKGCYGTASNPVNSVPNTVPRTMPQAPGNPPAGVSATPNATPSSGAGGSAGGPAGAAVKPGGAAGTGTVSGATSGTGRVATQSGTEQQNCGAPGQPVCTVKVDENGVPAGSGTSFDSANTATDNAKQSATDGINAAASMQAPQWSFSFQLPSGCSSYQVANFKGTSFSMNPCQYQSTIHDLMSMLWAAVTAFCIIGMVGRTIREA